MLGNTQQNPLLQDLFKLLSAAFQRICIGPDPIESRNLAIEGAIIWQNFISCSSHGSSDVVRKHMDSFLLDFDLVLITLLFYLIDRSFEISHASSFKASQKSSEVRLSSIMGDSTSTRQFDF